MPEAQTREGDVVAQFGLVGRERELVDLEQAVFVSGAGMVLCGERGVGKTALWDEFLTRAADRVAVSRVIATEASQSIPFGALPSLLVQLPSSPLNTAQLLEIAKVNVRERAGAEPLVLGVDEAHLLDDASATLVDQLARAGEVIVVASHSSDYPLPGWLQQLIQLDRIRHYELRPLEMSAVAAMISNVLGGVVDDDVVTELVRLSGGNPLIVRQLCATALASGALVHGASVDGESSWTLQGGFVATGHLGEILDTRLAACDPADLAILEIASVGGPIELGFLEAVGGHALVEALEAGDLITVDSNDGRTTARLQHPLLSERIEQSMPVTRRRRINRALAEWVAATGARRRDDALRVSMWELSGGITTRPDLAVLAARAALASADPGLAQRLCQAAVSADGGFDAHLTLGRALFELGRAVQADAVLAAAQRLATDDAELARAAVARCEVLALGTADLNAAVDVASEAVSTISDSDQLDVLAVEFARLALAAGDPQEAIMLGQRITAHHSASDHAVVTSLVVSAQANVMVGRFDDAIEDTRRGLGLLDGGAEGPHLARDQLLLAQTDALLYAGQLTQAGHTTTYPAAEPDDLCAADGAWLAKQGRLALLRGDLTTSLASYDHSVASLAAHDPLGLLSWVRACQAMTFANAGDVASVEKVLAGIKPDFVKAQYRVQVLVERANTWIGALKEDTEAAAHETLKVGLSAIDHHHFPVAAVALHDAVRFGHADVVISQLSELSARLEGVLFSTFAQHAAALCADDGAALDVVTNAYATMGANLLAAEAASQAATSHRGANDVGSARRSQVRAQALLAYCSGAGTPAIRYREPLLTPRQDQIARLATKNSNAQIATRLNLSVRTVENHLHAVYHTLDVHDRSDLAAIFGPAGFASL